MEAEVVAFVACCRELFLIIDIVDQVGTVLHLPRDDPCKMHFKVHKDNAGALALLKMKPPQFTTRSKHYAIKTNWFCKQMIARGIEAVKIDTTEQRGDIFTKGLVQATFEYLHKLIMVW